MALATLWSSLRPPPACTATFRWECRPQLRVQLPCYLSFLLWPEISPVTRPLFLKLFFYFNCFFYCLNLASKKKTLLFILPLLTKRHDIKACLYPQFEDINAKPEEGSNALRQVSRCFTQFQAPSSHPITSLELSKSTSITCKVKDSFFVFWRSIFLFQIFQRLQHGFQCDDRRSGHRAHRPQQYVNLPRSEAGSVRLISDILKKKKNRSQQALSKKLITKMKEVQGPISLN